MLSILAIRAARAVVCHPCATPAVVSLPGAGGCDLPSPAFCSLAFLLPSVPQNTTEPNAIERKKRDLSMGWHPPPSRDVVGSGPMSSTKLRKWRKSQGFSINACAQGAGVARFTWTRAEQGRAVSLDVANRIVEYVVGRGGTLGYPDLLSIEELQARKNRPR